MDSQEKHLEGKMLHVSKGERKLDEKCYPYFDFFVFLYHLFPLNALKNGQGFFKGFEYWII